MRQWFFSALVLSASAGAAEGNVRVATEEGGGIVLEARPGPAGAWHALARSSPEGAYQIEMVVDGAVQKVAPILVETRTEGSGEIFSRYDLPFGRLFRRIQPLPTTPFWRVENRLEINKEVKLARLTDEVAFLPKDPEFIWSQNLKWSESDVLPHWTFKFPALILQKEEDFFGLMADVDMITADLLKQAPLGFDLAVGPDGGHRAGYGFLAYQRSREHHVQYVYAPEKAPVLREGTFTWAWFPFLAADAPRQEGFRALVRFVWERWGHPRFLEGADAQRGTDEMRHLCLFDDWRNEAWNLFGPKVYHEWERGDEKRGGYATFWIKDPNVWFASWFASVRTAYGEMLYGRRVGDKRAQERAQAAVNLILSAPRREGAFPSIYVNQNGKDTWIFRNRKGPASDCYATFDMTWTGYWLLRFHGDLTPQDGRILPFCRDLGEFLLARQLPTGAVPSFFGADLAPAPEMKEVNAETSGAGLFWAVLYGATKDERFLTAARKAHGYIWREIVPTRRWFDFEAFISCSAKPFDFYDPWTRQYPANTLSMIRAAQAAVALFEATGEKAYLEQAACIADGLLLHQQPWSHPLMRENLIGGVAVQNSDLEWSDTRAPYAAELLFSLYEHTGALEYLERAVAALRANFKVSPRENWGHEGDEKGPTGRAKFHWGTGSGAATLEMYVPRYGEAYVHAGRRYGVGIDGCTLRHLEVADGSLSVRIDSPFQWPRPARLVIEGLAPGRPTAVTVNGTTRTVTADAASRAEVPFTMVLAR